VRAIAKQVRARVISNAPVLPRAVHARGQTMLGTRLVWLDCPGIAAAAKPGQFVMVRCDDLPLPRPFSVHRVKENSLALYFAILERGKGTNWLADRQPGDKLELFGPLGNGFTVRPDTRKLLLVAGGIGVAPLVFLAEDAVAKGLSVTLLMGAHTATQLYHAGLPDGIVGFVATDDGSDGEHGLVTSLVPRFASQSDQVFACGPTAMYKAMAQMKELKGKPVQVSLETVMGCGRGVCYSCTIKTRRGLKQVCQDGPIFDLDDVLWGEMGL
jgi:dihydroorotate dehydrogenase electron transfer subunit